MRRFALSIVVIVSAGSMVTGQKVLSEKELDQAMKTIGAWFRETEAELSASAFADAKVPLSLTRQVLASTGPFWLAQSKVDAAKMVQRVVEQLDTLDAVISKDKVDSAAVAATAGEVASACAMCHAVYREGDAQAGYRIKRESK